MATFQTIEFNQRINATAQSVWAALWQPEFYQQWTAIFSTGSYYNGDLAEGNLIQFLGTDGGMSSLVKVMDEPRHLVFAHQKEIKDGVETGTSWHGAEESYQLDEKRWIYKLADKNGCDSRDAGTLQTKVSGGDCGDQKDSRK